ncbi:hypothetical protein M3201_00645 [Paenibacillus motobuensis]|uniref:hypothetical protein n=1 Tax=Paenibacillus TaxID=44249 RepID=UPI0020413CAC|nr:MULTISPECIES: hypothetical protein [Paenibacillus]MCM3038212.1 hypothetical protein [Paenibacillus lutimineralis]MCM3645316.1 hypothetical protein [Paenibacillus motobuensis]
MLRALSLWESLYFGGVQYFHVLSWLRLTHFLEYAYELLRGFDERSPFGNRFTSTMCGTSIAQLVPLPLTHFLEYAYKLLRGFDGRSPFGNRSTLGGVQYFHVLSWLRLTHFLEYAYELLRGFDGRSPFGNRSTSAVCDTSMYCRGFASLTFLNTLMSYCENLTGALPSGIALLWAVCGTPRH